jgi:hypothetical protein
MGEGDSRRRQIRTLLRNREICEVQAGRKGHGVHHLGNPALRRSPVC